MNIFYDRDTLEIKLISESYLYQNNVDCIQYPGYVGDGSETRLEDVYNIRDMIMNRVRERSNTIVDELSDLPIQIILENGRSRTFKVSGNAKFDINEYLTEPDAFPMIWRCEDGYEEITYTDLKNVKSDYIARRKDILQRIASLVYDGFDTMTIKELLDWVKDPK